MINYIVAILIGVVTNLMGYSVYENGSFNISNIIINILCVVIVNLIPYMKKI